MEQAQQKQGKKALLISEERIRTIEVSEAESSAPGEIAPFDEFDAVPPPEYGLTRRRMR
jgi:hypothetical protein